MRALSALFLTFLTFGSAETINFDAARPGFIPPGWSVSSTDAAHPANWQVQAENQDPAHRRVLAQLAPLKGRQDYSLALFDRSRILDGEVSVHLKLMSGKLEQSAGVVWRFQDNGNYYFALASADKDSVGIYKKTNNIVAPVAHASVPHRIDDREWNLMKVTFRGARMALYFDHRKLIDVEDKTIAKSGKSGVWTKADTVAYFDHFRMEKKN